MGRPRRLRASGGTPIEEAPLWALAILTVLLSLIVFFPALVGLLDGAGAWRGEVLRTALAASAVGTLVVAGLARQKPWKRRRPGSFEDPTPVFARFSSWLIGVFLYPHVLHGALVLFRGGESIDYRASLLIGGIVSAIQGIAAWIDRFKRRRAAGVR